MVAAQWNEIHAMANERTIIDQGLARRGNSDHDVVLTGKAAEQSVKTGKQRNEKSALLMSTRLLDGLVRCGRNLFAERSATEAL